MENKQKLIKKIIIAVVIFILGLIIFKAFFLIKTYVNYTSKVEYNEDKQFHYENYGDYSIVADSPNVLDKEISVAVEFDDVYYDENHPEITITFDIYVNIYGGLEYCIGFSDEEDEEFGGYTYITDKMEIIPENEYDKKTIEKNQEHMEVTKETINKIVDIANVKWGLNLQKMK